MSTTPQSYPAYKPSGVPWLGDVPAHWEVRRLRFGFRCGERGHTFHQRSGLLGTATSFGSHQTTSARLRSRYVTNGARQITEEGHRSCGTTMAPANSLAVSTRAPIGHLGILRSEGCVNQGCRLLDTGYFHSDRVSALHLLEAAAPTLASLGQGSTFTELTRTQLYVHSAFPLPPLPEQARHRALPGLRGPAHPALRHHQAAKLIALLEEEKQAVVNRAVTRGLDPNVRLKPSGVEWLGDVPEHWEVRPLNDLLQGDREQ